MHEWRNVNTSSFSSQDCLLHGEKRCGKGIDAEDGQSPARLQAFPRGEHFHTQSGRIKIWLEALAVV